MHLGQLSGGYRWKLRPLGVIVKATTASICRYGGAAIDFEPLPSATRTVAGLDGHPPADGYWIRRDNVWMGRSTGLWTPGLRSCGTRTTCFRQWYAKKLSGVLERMPVERALLDRDEDWYAG